MFSSNLARGWPVFGSKFIAARTRQNHEQRASVLQQNLSSFVQLCTSIAIATTVRSKTLGIHKGHRGTTEKDVTRSTEAAERPTVGQGVPRPRKEEETTTSTPPIEGSSPPIEGDATQHERRVTKRAARKAARKHAARTALSGRVSSEVRTELSAAADGVPRSEHGGGAAGGASPCG